MRRAALDIGSNSILLLVADLAGDRLTPVHEQIWYPRLGEGLAASGRLATENMACAGADIAAALAVARKWGAVDIVAAATAAVREAANGAEFVGRLLREPGIEVRILSGREEAECTWLGGISHLEVGDDPVCTLDIGGASSECARGRGGMIEAALSAPIGVVRLVDRFGLSPGEFPLALELIRSKLAPLAEIARGCRLVGVGGTITTLAAVNRGSAAYEPEEIARIGFHLDELNTYIELFRSLGIEEIREMPGMEPRRADVIEAGVSLFATFMEMAGIDTIGVSPRGLRYGLLLLAGAKQPL